MPVYKIIFVLPDGIMREDIALGLFERFKRLEALRDQHARIIRDSRIA